MRLLLAAAGQGELVVAFAESAIEKPVEGRSRRLLLDPAQRQALARAAGALSSVADCPSRQHLTRSM